MGEEKEMAMNGAGVEELGFPMWPQFDPQSRKDIVDILDSGLVSYGSASHRYFQPGNRAWG